MDKVKWLIAVGGAAALAMLAGCSAGESEFAVRDRAAIEQALHHATSDFERRILEDYVITRSEYEEAVAVYVDCVKAAGWDMTAHSDGGIYSYEVVFSGASPDWTVPSGFDRADMECSVGSKELIAPLYVGALQDATDNYGLAAVIDCLVDTGVIEAPILQKELLEYLRSAHDPLATPPPWDIDDPRAIECGAAGAQPLVIGGDE